MENNLIIAGAGVGKTTYLVKKTLELKNKKILITTFTEANEIELKNKFIEINGCIPKNVEILTWFSFLLRHCVKPYQGIMFEELYEKDIKGLLLVNQESGVLKKNGKIIHRISSEKIGYYFDNKMRIFSDKVSNFVINCNIKSENKIIKRLSEVFDCIFIDEVQDLAGYDLEIIKLLFESLMDVNLVGDPRQVTYNTHYSKKNQKYNNGRIKEYLEEKINKKIKFNIDNTTLIESHRNNEKICNFGNKLYPVFNQVISCQCCYKKEENHLGIFIVRKKNLDNYLKNYNPIQITWNNTVKINPEFSRINFGNSKGLSYDRVLIYPTIEMKKWLKNNNQHLSDETRSKLYVGITRARFSVAFVIDDNEEIKNIENIQEWRS